MGEAVPWSPTLAAAPPRTGKCVRSLRSGRLPIRTRVTSSLADVQTEAPDEYRTTETPCLVCMTTLSLDDEKPRTGAVRWRVARERGLTMGSAVSFDCPNGHSSDEDPELLKAFPRRRFW